MDRSASRTAGSVLVVGTVIMLIGAAIPPLVGPGIEAWTADWERSLDIIVEHATAWRVANALIVLGAVVTSVGIALVGNILRALDRRSEAAAATALFPVGIALEAVNRASHITIDVWAAEAKAAGDLSYQVFEAVDQWRSLLGDMFLLLGTFALVVIGFGFGRAGQPTLAIVGIGFGAFGLALALFSALVPAVLFLGTGALGLMILISTPREP